MTNTETELGVIVKGVGGLYYARDQASVVHVLRAKGSFRKRHITPLVGDAIRFSPGAEDDQGWIEEVLPRINELVRPPVANIRNLMLVLSPEPEPDFLLLERADNGTGQTSARVVVNTSRAGPDGCAYPRETKRGGSRLR